MDPWRHIERAAADRRSGSVGVATRAAKGLAELTTSRQVLRAARTLLRAHPAMAPLWGVLAVALEADDRASAVRAYVSDLESETDAAADAIRWVVGGRNAVVVVHSASASVHRALRRIRARVATVLCTVSLPGGEGRSFARRLERDGFATEVVPDAAVALACARAHLAVVGADAVTEDAIVNKVGTHPLALAAIDAGIGIYAIAATAKYLPEALLPEAIEGYESTPLRLFDAVLTERGPRRGRAVQRGVARVHTPAALVRAAP